MRKKLMVVTAMLMAGSLFAAGCAQQGAAEGESSSTEVQYQNSIEEAEAYLDGVNERQDELNKEYAPEIRTLEDGTKVQRADRVPVLEPSVRRRHVIQQLLS